MISSLSSVDDIGEFSGAIQDCVSLLPKPMRSKSNWPSAPNFWVVLIFVVSLVAALPFASRPSCVKDSAKLFCKKRAGWPVSSP